MRVFLLRAFLPLLLLTACQDIGLKAAVQKLVTLRHRIAYASDLDTAGASFEVYVMEFDGSNVRRITEDEQNSIPVAWSPDGQYLAIFSGALPTALRFWDADTGRLIPIPETVGYGFLSWSPDGRYMLLADPGSNMEIRNRYGSGRVPVPQIDRFLACWSTVTGRLVFADNVGNWEIFTMNLNGSEVRNLTNDGAADYQPLFSPDGSRIAFISTREGTAHSYVMDADGTNLHRTGKVDQLLSWSPTGARILTYDGVDFWTTNADFEQEILLPNIGGADSIQWGPDGARLIFSENISGFYEIFSIYPDGTYKTNLTNDPGNDMFKCFSPDGKRIVFESDRDGNSDIYTMDLDGSNLINLTNNPANDVGPIW